MTPSEISGQIVGVFIGLLGAALVVYLLARVSKRLGLRIFKFL